MNDQRQTNCLEGVRAIVRCGGCGVLVFFEPNQPGKTWGHLSFNRYLHTFSWLYDHEPWEQILTYDDQGFCYALSIAEAREIVLIELEQGLY